MTVEETPCQGVDMATRHNNTGHVEVKEKGEVKV